MRVDPGAVRRRGRAQRDHRALRDGDEYVVHGSKTFITNGLLSDLVPVVAKTNPGERAAGVSLIAVETSRPGFSRGRNLEKAVELTVAHATERTAFGKPLIAFQSSRTWSPTRASRRSTAAPTKS
ncbi:MAG TPA: acyl-CoA dehydrogenase family protein [Streptosporangiaceae bacterium]